MANKNENKKSGFNAPAYGTMLPDGAKIKVRKDGGFEIVHSNEKSATKNSNKKK